MVVFLLYYKGVRYCLVRSVSETLEKCVKICNQYSICDGIWLKRGLVDVSKNTKILKSDYLRPLLRDYVPLVVIVWWGCLI